MILSLGIVTINGIVDVGGIGKMWERIEATGRNSYFKYVIFHFLKNREQTMHTVFYFAF